MVDGPWMCWRTSDTAARSVVVVGGTGTKKIGKYVVTSPCGDGFVGRQKRRKKSKIVREEFVRGYSGFDTGVVGKGFSSRWSRG
jgi:hypothetical protein